MKSCPTDVTVVRPTLMAESDTGVGMSGKKVTLLTGVEQLHSKVDSQHVIVTAADERENNVYLPATHYRLLRHKNTN